MAINLRRYQLVCGVNGGIRVYALDESKYHSYAYTAGLGGSSDWRPGGRRFNPRRGRQHSFVEIDREIFSTVILSLPQIQEGQLSECAQYG